MTTYMLSVYNLAGVHEREFGPYADEAEMQAAFARTAEFNGDLDSAGQLVYAAGLTPPSEAFTVEKNGTRIPGQIFTASAYLGGFWIITAESEEQAREIATRAAAACGNAVEVRPLPEE